MNVHQVKWMVDRDRQRQTQTHWPLHQPHASIADPAARAPGNKDNSWPTPPALTSPSAIQSLQQKYRQVYL